MNPGLFFDPAASDDHQAARAMHGKVQDLLLDLMSSSRTRLPMPALANASLPARLPALLPETGRTIDDILPELHALLAGSMNVANPGFIGHMDSIATIPGMLGEWLAAAVNNNMLSLEMAPTLVRLEQQAMRSIASWFGLGPDAGGTMLSGGTLANLQALAVARNDQLDCQQHGLAATQSGPALTTQGAASMPWVILASQAAHTSLQKAAMLLGLGSAAVRPVATDRQQRMCLDDLARQLQDCQQQGQRVLCVVATAGTTVSGSIDPLAAIARLCQAQRIWLHVDAAYGGALILSPRYRHLLDGIEHADSITFNPQKWLYLPKTCATLLFRDRQRWQRAFRVAAPYMAHHDEDCINPGEISVQGTRHADILKLWFSLQCTGRATQAQLIEQCMDHTAFFTGLLHSRPWLTLLHEPSINLVCFRAQVGQDDAACDGFNSAMVAYLNQQNLAFFSLPMLHGQRWCRAVLLNPHLTQDHLLAIVAGMDAFYHTHTSVS